MGQPREVDIDMFNCPQELFESVEDLQCTVAELQSLCGDCEQRNQHLQQQLLDKEREFSRRIKELNEEMSALRNTKVRIARENIMKECPVTPRWFVALIKSVEQEKKIADLNSQVNDLKLEVMEKGKVISSLQHQLKDSEATIAVLTSDRNHLAVVVNDLVLRLEELESSNTAHKDESASYQAEATSFNSYEDEAMGLSDKHRRVHCATSDQSEEGSEGFVPLKRAVNFNNINSLDESANFELERQNGTTSKELSGNYSSKATADRPISSPSCSVNRPSEVTSDKKNPHDIICTTNEEGRTSCSGSAILHKDTSWERFDRSNSNAKLSSLVSNEAGKTLPTLIGDSTELDAFKELDVRSPFTQLAESTPVARSPSAGDNAASSHAATTPSGIGDPWLSPGQSPIASKKPKSTSRNLFWEKNEDCTIYPFFVPDSNEAKDPVENGVTSKPVFGTGTPSNDHRDAKEPLKTTNGVRISSPSKLSSFSLDEKMVSFDDDSQKTARIVVKKASKENLWDFEPDSIVDVSTGQTIYESLKKDDECHTSGSESCDSEHVNSKQNSNDLSCLEKYLPVEDHPRCLSDVTSDMSDDKAKSLAEALDKRSGSRAKRNSQQKDREFVRKGTRKEREALKAYMQWKIEGKQGVPPANFKISLC